VKVRRVDRPHEWQTVRDVVVDTGATASALPAKVLRQLGIELPFKRTFTLATGRSVTRRVGVALLEYDGRMTSDDVIALEKGTPLLGVRALEGMGFEVDPRTKKLKKLEGGLFL